MRTDALILVLAAMAAGGPPALAAAPLPTGSPDAPAPPPATRAGVAPSLPRLPGAPPAPPRADALAPRPPETSTDIWSRIAPALPGTAPAEARSRDRPAPAKPEVARIQVDRPADPVKPLPASQPLRRVPLAPPPATPAQPGPEPRPAPQPVPQPPAALPRTFLSDVEELVVEVHLRGRPLLDGALVLRRGRELLVPLAELADGLEVAVTVDDAAGTADGWVLSEERRFGIDIPKGEAVAGGVRQALAPGDALVSDGALYVTAALLGKLWPVRASLDGRQGILHLDPVEAFPVEARLDRERRRERLVALDRGPAKPLPRADDARRWLAMPSVDLAAEVGYLRGDVVAQHSVLATGDFATLTLRAFATGDDGQAVRAARLSLEQDDDGGGVLGVGPLRSAAFGDVVTPGIPLVANSRLNRGVYLSTAPLDLNPEFNRTTIDGDGPAGYEAELYRGDDLIAFQRVGADGRYVFDRVPLTLGRNLFRIVLHGPQGQRIERSRTVTIAGGLVPAGTGATRLSATQSGRGLFDAVRRQPGSPDRSGGLAATLEHTQGLGEAFSVSGVLARVPLRDRVRMERSLEAPVTEPGPDGVGSPLVPGLDEDEEVVVSQEMGDFAGASLAGSVLGSFLRGGVVASGDGGTAWEGSLVTALAGWDLTLDQAWFDGFESAVAGEGDAALTSRTNLRAGTTFAPWWVLPRTVLDVNAARERRVGGTGSTEATAGLGGRLGQTRFQLFAGVRETLSPGAPDALDSVGSVEMAHRLGLSELTLAYVHDLDGEGPRQLVASLSDDRFADTRFRLGASYSFDGGGKAALVGSAYREFDQFALGVQARWEDGGETYVGLGLTTSFGPGPSGPVLSRQPLAASGAAAVRVYRDMDGDGRFGPADAPVAGARPIIGSGTRGEPTGPDGTVLVPGLTPGVPVPVAVDGGSLEDPVLQPAGPGVNIVPRPGTPVAIDLAVVEMGEVEGLVLMPAHDGEIPIPRVTVELVAQDGTVLAGRSVFDGVFNLSRVPPGSYLLRLAEGQTFRGRALMAAPVPFTLERDDPVRFDLLLEVRYADQTETAGVPR